MKFRLALFVGLLCATSSLFATASTDATSEANTATTPSVATSGAPSADTTVTGGSTNSPASSVTAASTGSTVSGGSTVTGGPTNAAASTAAVSTEAASTVSSAPTTLPSVPFSCVQFGTPVCVNATCTYEIDAPVNNQAVLATDQSVIDGDRTQFGGLQSEASKKDADVKSANDDAVNKIKKIQTMIDQIQSQLDLIQNMTQTIKAQQNSATSTISFVETFISGIGQDSCLWQRCLKPTTPAPPTTTPTPAPTTTPDPCLSFNCSLALPGASTTCTLTSTNQPFCNNCPGDMDGLTGCTTVACPLTTTPFNTDDNGNGTWYSVGYNITSGNHSIPASSNCVYQLNGTFVSADGLNLTCLASGNVQITFSSSDGSFSQSIASSTSKRALNNLLNKIPNGKITLTSSAEDNSLCQIPLSTISSTSFEEEEVPEKKNGFFSWLMGY